MERYGIIDKKQKREIVLLKGRPCFWGKCAFCDYIADNSTDEAEIEGINRKVLDEVTGRFKALEVINSGNVFELTEATKCRIKEVCFKKDIERLYFESHWAYHKRLDEIRNYFSIPIVFKCGIETFDHHFRNEVLKKGAYFDDPKEVARYMDSICILVGIKGQTKDMIRRDIDILERYFQYGCVNIYSPNTTDIKLDNELISWFKEEYDYLNQSEKIDVLWNNTDFGVGG